MASYQRLPSGKWRGRVKRNGRVVASFSHPLKGTVERWARDVERRLDAGEWVDPRLSKVTVAAWHERWLATTRLVAPNTRTKDASHWRTHVGPRWGETPLSAVERDDVRAWVREMHEAGTGAHTIHGAVHLLSAMLEAAVEAGRVGVNPCHRVSLPTPDLKLPFFWTREEARAFVAAFERPWALMVDLDLHVGLRWGELAGLKRRALDLDQGLIHVAGTQTRQGWVPITKGRALRTVPVPAHLCPALAAHVAGLAPDALVFTAPDGGVLRDTNFRRREWQRALDTSGVRPGSPHDMRHTAASWLVMDGVDLYRVQALLGHESFRTTQRYSHLAPSAHDAILAAWAASTPGTPEGHKQKDPATLAG